MAGQRGEGRKLSAKEASWDFNIPVLVIVKNKGVANNMYRTTLPVLGKENTHCVRWSSFQERPLLRSKTCALQVDSVSVISK